jgi:hypothetical protein
VDQACLGGGEAETPSRRTAEWVRGLPGVKGLGRPRGLLALAPPLRYGRLTASEGRYGDLPVVPLDIRAVQTLVGMVPVWWPPGTEANKEPQVSVRRLKEDSGSFRLPERPGTRTPPGHGPPREELIEVRRVASGEVRERW